MYRTIMRWAAIFLCLMVSSGATSSAAPPTQDDQFPVAPGLLTWAANGQTLVVTSRVGLDVYDVGQWETPRIRLGTDVAYSVVMVVVDADGSRVAALPDPSILETLDVDEERRAQLGWVWDSATGAELFELTGHDLLQRIDAVAFSPDGTLVAYGGLADGWIHVRDVPSGAEVVTLNPVANSWEPGQVIPDLLWIGFSPDGSTLASSHRSGGIVLWDVAAWEQRAVLHSSNAQFNVRFSPNGETLVAINTTLGMPEVWRVSDGQSLLMEDGPWRSGVEMVGFDADGRALGVYLSPSLLEVYDLENGMRKDFGFLDLFPFSETSPDLAFTTQPNTMRYIQYDSAQNTGKLWLIDVIIETVILGVEVPGCITDSAVSPDGAYLAVGISGAVHLWDISTGEQVGTITLPDAPLPAFSAIDSPDHNTT